MTELLTPARQRTALTTEYVAGGVGIWARDGLRSLPSAFDDLSNDFGADIYERMLLDPQVIAVVNILRAAIIEEGVRLACPVTDDAADGYALGQEIKVFCESVLADLQIPIDDVLWDLLKAIALGSRAAEQVYQHKQATTYALPGTAPVSRTRQLLVLSALKPKPQGATSFVVDAHMNVQGLLGQQPGQGMTLGMGSLTVASARQLPNLFDRRKFAVFSFRPENADPRGSTVLRPAYTPWWVKQQLWPELLKYLAQFASPSIYAIASEAASKMGITVTNEDGSKTTRSAASVLLDTLLAFRNGTAAAFDYGTILQALETVGDGEPFYRAFTQCDEQITIAVLHQTLATREARHQSRASSEVHQDTLDTIQRQAKRGVCTMVYRDILRPLVEYNYGQRAAQQLTPHCSLGSVEQQDFAGDATAIGVLARSGYLHPSQYPGIDERLGLPVREQSTEPEPEPTDSADEESSVDAPDDEEAIDGD